jgi:hypothetical protein
MKKINIKVIFAGYDSMVRKEIQSDENLNTFFDGMDAIDLEKSDDNGEAEDLETLIAREKDPVRNNNLSINTTNKYEGLILVQTS